MVYTKQENMEYLEKELKETKGGSNIFQSATCGGLIEGYYRAGIINIFEYLSYKTKLTDLMLKHG